MFAYRGWGAKQKGERQKEENREGQVANLATYSAMGMEGGNATAVEWKAAILAPAQSCREEEYSCCQANVFISTKIIWSGEPSPLSSSLSSVEQNKTTANQHGILPLFFFIL
jgi:hypothetical protein